MQTRYLWPLPRDLLLAALVAAAVGVVGFKLEWRLGYFTTALVAMVLAGALTTAAPLGRDRRDWALSTLVAAEISLPVAAPVAVVVQWLGGENYGPAFGIFAGSLAGSGAGLWRFALTMKRRERLAEVEIGAKSPSSAEVYVPLDTETAERDTVVLELEEPYVGAGGMSSPAGQTPASAENEASPAEHKETPIGSKSSSGQDEHMTIKDEIERDRVARPRVTLYGRSVTPPGTAAQGANPTTLGAKTDAPAPEIPDPLAQQQQQGMLGAKEQLSEEQIKSLLEQLKTCREDRAMLSTHPESDRIDRAISTTITQLESYISSAPPPKRPADDKLKSLIDYGNSAAKAYFDSQLGSGGPAGKVPFPEEVDASHLAVAVVIQTGSGIRPPPERVNCSVFAPAACPPGHRFLVQVFVYPPLLREQVEQLATLYDETSSCRGFRVLQQLIQRGEQLTFLLHMPGLEVEEAKESLVWQGEAESVQFAVRVPAAAPLDSVVGRVTVLREGVPVGVIRFTLWVQSRPAPDAPELTGDYAQPFRCAFISYASADRAKVLPRVQALQRVGIDCFQDILHLEPGERWERKLYQKIDHCDVFLLFWSSAAKASEWVMKEVHYALGRKGGHDAAPPEVLPVPIEGPPPVEPPPELAHLHFNDPFLYFMAVE